MTPDQKTKIIEFLKSIYATDAYRYNRILTETDYDEASNLHVRFTAPLIFHKEILDYQEPLMSELIKMQMRIISEINIVRQKLIEAYTK